MTAILSVAEEPAENPPSKVAGERKSSSAFTSLLAGGNFDVDGEAVEQIAAPFQSLAAGGEFEAGEVDDGAVGSMLAGNPLGIIEGQVAGAGGNLQLGVEDFAGGRSGVYGDGDGWRVADQPETEKKRTQTTPKMLESFIFRAPVSMMKRIAPRQQNFRL